MSKSVTKFYDRLAPVFHHNMGYDWEEGVRWEGEWLNRFFASQLPDPAMPEKGGYYF